MNELAYLNGKFNLGEIAYYQGLKQEKCPYKKGTKEYIEWIDGWQCAKQFPQ
jgi:ribosome modulation factor